jgi:drug/metabolite transporter (DMT)-like permease
MRQPAAGHDARRGALFAMAAGVSFGTLGIFGTLFYDKGGDSFTLLVMRFCGAALVLVAIALSRRRPPPGRADALLAGFAGVGLVAATFCLFAGFEDASPGLVTLLFYVYPLLVTLGDRTLFGVSLGRRRAVLLAVGMAGIALTVGVEGSASLAGGLWGLAAGVFTSAYILGSRHVMSRTVDPIQFLALALGCGALLVLAVAALAGVERPPAEGLPFAACLIVLSTVVAMLFLYSAIDLVGAGTAARLATLEPVTAVVLSYIVLGDSLTATQITGGTAVLVSVVLLARS